MRLDILIIVLGTWAGIAGCLVTFFLAQQMMRPLEAGLKRYGYLFLLCVSYILAEGILMVAAGSSYYLNIRTSSLLGFMAVLGIVSWSILGYAMRGKFLSFSFPQFSAGSLSRAEKGIIVFVAGLIVLYGYKILIPCSDHDELAVYGNFSKLIANGWTFSDLIPYVGLRSRVFESWDALFYAVFNDSFGIRALRLINLIVCGGMVVSFLRLFFVSRIWSLWALGAFLGIAEFSALGVSMKVDLPLMMFELAGMLCLVGSIVTFVKFSETVWNRKAVLWLASMAVVAAGMACLGRVSGGYLLVFSLVSVGVLSWLMRQEVSWRQKLGVVLAVAFAGWVLMAAWCIVTYRNPLSPFTLPFFNGNELMGWKSYRDIANIQLPFGILQVYLVFALITGIEWLDKFFHFPSWVPMAHERMVTMGWAFPVLTALAAVPLFWKRAYSVRVMTVLFCWEFIIWSLGIQYSRVLLATVALMTILTALMAHKAFFEQKMDRHWRWFFQCVAVLVLVHSLFMHVLVTANRFRISQWPVGVEKRYQAKVRFLQSPVYNEPEILSPEDAASIDAILASLPKARVVVHSFSGRVIQILFDNGFFSEYTESLLGWGNFLLVHTPYISVAPLPEAWQKDFKQQVFASANGTWRLYAR